MKKTIAWLIPSLIEGSGGHRTMLQHAHALEQAGYVCHLYIEGSGAQESAAAQVEKLFGYRFPSVRFGWEAIGPVDLAIATIWYSAAVVRDLPFDCVRAYFVQDYEALFNPMGDTYLMAENSYRYGLVPVTIGRWLRHELFSRFAVPAWHFEFGADHAVYRPLAGHRREQAVCFIYQPDKPRRCSRIGIEALGIVRHLRPDVKIYLYGSAQSEKGHIWFEHEHLGLLSLQDCNALYNRCAVGLCLSSSNPSRIPFEMMAAGLPVVELWRENNRHDLPDSAVSLSEQTPESLAENILRLLDDEQARARMSEAGIAFMQDRPLERETREFISAIDGMLRGESPAGEVPGAMYRLPPVRASLHVQTLPDELRDRLQRPRNAWLHALPQPLQHVLRRMVRKMRRWLAS